MTIKFQRPFETSLHISVPGTFAYREATNDDLRAACEAVGLVVCTQDEKGEAIDEREANLQRVYALTEEQRARAEKAKAELAIARADVTNLRDLHEKCAAAEETNVNALRAKLNKAEAAYEGVLQELRRELSVDWLAVEDLTGAVRDLVGQCKAAEKARITNRERAEKAEDVIGQVRDQIGDPDSDEDIVEVARRTAVAFETYEAENKNLRASLSDAEIRSRCVCSAFRHAIQSKETAADDKRLADVYQGLLMTGENASYDRARRALYQLGQASRDTEFSDLRAKLAAAEGTLATLRSSHSSYLEERTALHAKLAAAESRLFALTAPVEGEPSDDKLAMEWNAGIHDGVDTLVAGRRALYRLGVQHERARHQPTEPRATVTRRATVEELVAVFDEDHGQDTERDCVVAGVRAVATRVRAERPACLVERAVASGRGVAISQSEEREDQWGIVLEKHPIRRIGVPAASVRATLDAMLTEVGA